MGNFLKITPCVTLMQRGKTCPHRLWFHIGNFTWWKHAVRECSLQIEPRNDSVARSIRCYEKQNMASICEVDILKNFSNLSFCYQRDNLTSFLHKKLVRQRILGCSPVHGRDHKHGANDARQWIALL